MLGDVGQRLRVLLAGHGDPDDVGAGGLAAAMACRVRSASWVGVTVIVCTLIGASPPTSSGPSRILRVGRRCGGGRSALATGGVVGAIGRWSGRVLT
jgi:hypothetical protein